MRVKSVLALVAVPAIVLAACTSGATPSPSASAPGASAPASAPAVSAPASAPASAVDRRAGNRPAPAPVGAAGPVRRLLRGREAGLLRGREPDRHDGPGRRRTSIPQAVGSQPDGPEFTIAWVPKVLEAREAGSDLVDIAQVFQRSGTLSVSWKDNAIDDPCKFAGKKVGVWDFGNEFEVTAGALACGLTPGLENNGDPAKQYQKVIQPFDMTLLLSRQIDVGRGDDLQRVRPGPRGDEPRDRPALQARRPEHHQLERLPRRDAPGRDLRPQGVARHRAPTATSRSASSGPRSRAGSTAATTRTTASSTRPTPAASSAPGTRRG